MKYAQRADLRFVICLLGSLMFDNKGWTGLITAIIAATIWNVIEEYIIKNEEVK